MADPAVPVESTETFGKGAQGEAKRWKAEVELFESQQKNHWERCRKITRRYRNDSWRDAVDTAGQFGDSDTGRGFSLLWSNQQTLQPVIYAKEPKANVERRYKDKDPVARVAATIMERTLDYFIDKPDFAESTRQCRDDYLLVAQGVQRRRYIPHFVDVQKRIGLTPSEAFVNAQGVQISDDASEYSGGYSTEDDSEFTDEDRAGVKIDKTGPYIERSQREIKTEEVVRDHVNLRDFGWSPGARTWAEVYCVWFKSYLTRSELNDRFGQEIGEKIELDYQPKRDSEEGRADKDFFKKATIYEIWNKTSKKAIWIASKYDGDVLDERDDPLGLDGFFPCARPLFGSQTSDQVTPVPDYLEYQDQAEEMDRLTQKVYMLMNAIRVRGLYAGNIPEMQKLLQDSVDLEFQPVAESIVTMAAGDLSKMVWIWPNDQIVSALNELLIAREKVKQDSYEITGISDIIRGATDPTETLGAQELKAQSGAVRIQDRQREMQRFIRDGLRIDADIIMNHFQPDTIRDIADMSSIPEANYVMIGGKWRDPETMKAAGALPGETGDPMMGHNGGPPLQGAPDAGMMAPGGPPMPPAPPTGAPPVTPAGFGPPVAGGISPAPASLGVPPGIPMQPQGPTLGEAAIALLKDRTQRKFRIDIETDSTVQLDQAQEKADRNELVSSLTGFFGAIAPIVETEPTTIPMFTEILLFAVRGFKSGGSLEGSIESTMEALGNRPPKPAPPDPAMVKAQADAKAIEAKTQSDLTLKQAEGAREDQRFQMDSATRQQEIVAAGQMAQIEASLEAMRAENEKALGTMDMMIKRIELAIQGKKLEQADAGVDAAKAQAKNAAKPKPANGGA